MQQSSIWASDLKKEDPPFLIHEVQEHLINELYAKAR